MSTLLGCFKGLVGNHRSHHYVWYLSTGIGRPVILAPIGALGCFAPVTTTKIFNPIILGDSSPLSSLLLQFTDCISGTGDQKCFLEAADYIRMMVKHGFEKLTDRERRWMSHLEVDRCC